MLGTGNCCHPKPVADADKQEKGETHVDRMKMNMEDFWGSVASFTSRARIVFIESGFVFVQFYWKNKLSMNIQQSFSLKREIDSLVRNPSDRLKAMIVIRKIKDTSCYVMSMQLSWHLLLLCLVVQVMWKM